jgi:citrate lyase gamma subunit
MERERITISIKKGVLDKIDATIDGIIVRNRSHAIENLITKTLGKENLKNAVILVGGKGANKMLPKIKNIIKKLHQSGFNKIYIALGSLAENIQETIGNGEDLDVEIEYIKTENGSGGALIPLKKSFRDTFIVANPNNELNINIDDVIKFHKEHKSTATVATNKLSELKGLCIFEPEIFDFIPKGFSMLEEDILPKLSSKRELLIYPVF